MTDLSGPSKLPKIRQTLCANLTADSGCALGSFVVNIVEPIQRSSIVVRMKNNSNIYQIANIRVLIVYHGVFKGFQEVLLKFEVR